MAFVDVELIEGLALPYVAAAETFLDDVELDPVFATAWAGLVAAFPAASLLPLFADLAVQELTELVGAIRMNGQEPPDPFRWFTVPCDDAEAEALVVALQTLPLIAFAQTRSITQVAIVSYGTNPEAGNAVQIMGDGLGVNAIYAWSVNGGTGAGVTLADVEGGWLLTHQDLVSATIRKTSIFGSHDVDHGTAVAGIMVAADNGVGIVGIAPGASLDLVSEDRADGFNPASAVLVAARAVSTGGIVLVELGAAFRTPPGPDVPLELDRAFQVATRLATLFGVIVIEPAGNGGINLDTTPALAHTSPTSTTFVDSRTIMVGAGAHDGTGGWQRTFSSFGTRVDCFAAGEGVRAPSSAATDAYQNFSGTSSASAIIAGTAASVQGMVMAATGGQVLDALDMRRLFRNPALGTPSVTPATDLIGGGMPDLRKVALSLGLPRVLPVGLAASPDSTPTPGGGAVLVTLDDEDRLVRRHWSPLTGWAAPLPLPSGPSGIPFHLIGGQAAVTSRLPGPGTLIARHDVYLLGAAGLHHMFWDSTGHAGDISEDVAPLTALSQGSSAGVVQVADDSVVVAGEGPDGRLVVMNGDPRTLSAAAPLTTPLVIDVDGQYRRTSGPTVATRAEASADVVAIEDGGSLRWFTGNVLATIGTGWSAGLSDPSGTAYDPGARLAVLVLDDALVAAGVDVDGHLVIVGITPDASTFGSATFEPPVTVDAATQLASSGPVALATTTALDTTRALDTATGAAIRTVVVLAVDSTGTLRVAQRPDGGDFGTFATILCDVPISPLGGVVAVSLDPVGVLAVVIDTSGTIRFSVSLDGVLWPPLLPIF